MMMILDGQIANKRTERQSVRPRKQKVRNKSFEDCITFFHHGLSRGSSHHASLNIRLFLQHIPDPTTSSKTEKVFSCLLCKSFKKPFSLLHGRQVIS